MSANNNSTSAAIAPGSRWKLTTRLMVLAVPFVCILLLGVPAIGKWYEHMGPQGARRNFPFYNEMVRDLARAESTPLAEPARQAPGTPEFPTDWGHFAAKGEQPMAQIWFGTLEQAGWLGAKTAS